MPTVPGLPAIEPTAAQRAVASWERGALLVLGAAASGRSEAIARRIAELASRGVGPERVLVLTYSQATAQRIRGRAEALLAGPFEELWVATYETAAERLLREHAVEVGIDPFFEPIGMADRLAIMLERLEDLPLRRHEIRGNPAGLLARLLARIDLLKAEGVSASALEAWATEHEREAASEGELENARREREFAELYARHDQVLRSVSGLDRGDLVTETARLLKSRADVRKRLGERFPHVVADEFEDAGFAQRQMLAGLAAEAESFVVACDDDQAIHRFRGAASRNVADFRERHPDREEILLQPSFRSGDVLDAARAVVAGLPDRIEKPSVAGGEEASVRFWRCRNEPAEAQAVAREIEHLLAATSITPEQVAVIVASTQREGRPVAAALEERSIPFRVVGSAAFFQRPEVRDVIAWLRVLADPNDASAAVRALTRPPVELRSVDLARCTKIARRRKLDMVSALEAALESPQVAPEARERIQGFLKLYRAAAGALDELRADVFVRRLIERVGLRRDRLFAAQPEAAERLVNLSRLGDLAAAWGRRERGASTRDFIRYLAAVAEAGVPGEDAPEHPAPPAVRLLEPQQVKGLEFEHVYLLGLNRAAVGGRPAAGPDSIPDELLTEPLPAAGEDLASARRRRLAYTAITRARRALVLSWTEATAEGAAQPAASYEDARAVLGADEELHDEELFGPAEGMAATYRMVRDDVLEASWKAGGSLSELRLDTYMDVHRAVARFLEMLKMAALIQRPGGQTAPEAIEAINQVLRQVAAPEQWQEVAASALDEYLLDEEHELDRRRELIAARDEPSLEAFIPRRGEGLGLSASDIDLYRTCPLKYKFARVFAIPQEQTINQRFGILIHNVLQRFHADAERNPAGEEGLERLLGLFEAGWRRTGFGASDDELQFRDRAVAALARYHERHVNSGADPVWLERGFTFRLGPHQLRGRVDRIDRLAEGGYELIDYKTGQPKSVTELADDVQLAIYRLGAREAWNVEAEAQSYYYVLDDRKVAVASSSDDLERVERTVLEVGEGILGQDFEPRPSYEVCSWCDYRLICPAAET